MTVAQFLRERDVTWQRADPAAAHVHIRKPAHGLLSPAGYVRGYLRRLADSSGASVVLLGEPREASPLEYRFARPENTLACAPGNDLSRLYYAHEWVDPQLEGWGAREDRICWIGRPTLTRVALAARLEALGAPLDVYSFERWPVGGWRGPAADELETSRRYRYRIVAENSYTHGYHSEKLFSAIRSGCVTFYGACPTLSLPHLAGGFLSLDEKTIEQRGALAGGVVEAIGRVMFSNAWTVYSFRAFYERILEMARRAAGR